MMKLTERPPNKNGGMNEGIARAFSQACVYPIETRKTLLQIGGSAILMKSQPVHKWVTGLSTSCVTAGLVFCLYFSIYNALKPCIFAGSVASFITSVIKLPFGNSMRLMQCGTSSNLVNASKQLYKNKGFAGLYNGYGLCLVEDIIDMELRLRLYNTLQDAHSQILKTPRETSKESINPITCIGYGALSGAIACGITTPFDTVRARMCFNTAKQTQSTAYSISRLIILNEGMKGFYTGAPLRITSNAVRSGLFFCFLNIMNNIQ